MSFEPNLGQTDKQVKFLSHGPGYTLFLTPSEAVLSMRSPSKNSRPNTFGRLRTGSRAAATRRNETKKNEAGESAVVRIALKGATRVAQIEGVDRMAGRSNYFIGNDPKKWHTDVPNYAKVELKAVYPGIDLIYHGSERGQLEYDFTVAPGADPRAIRLGFKGACTLALDERGDLVVSAGGQKFLEHAPAIYQETANGKKQTVPGRWRLYGAHEAGFKLANYDRSKPIVIDPVLLLYSTYLGGRGQDYANGIAVDSAGLAYVTGDTDSADFPVTSSAFQSAPAGLPTAFVAKFNPGASGAASLVYSTYLGGSYGADANSIAVDLSGNAYVAGSTSSTDFPVRNAFQDTNRKASSFSSNAFLAKFNSSGDALLYSTYLGGSSENLFGDEGEGVAVDSAGDAYVAGNATSTDFPVKNAFQSTLSAAAYYSNAFLAKFNPAASGAASLLYSTYLGGSFGDEASAVAVDSAGFAYVTGQTLSIDFPILNAFQSTTSGGWKVFVSKLNPAASGVASLCYSTYLGGSSGSDRGYSIAVDSAGFAYVTGQTFSIDFPTLNAFQSTNNAASVGGSNAFVSKLNPAASGAASLLYSTYLGGSGLAIYGDRGYGIAADSTGFAYLTGYTESTDFPTRNAFQSACPFVPKACVAGYAAKLNPYASGAASLVYSTYLGGSDGESAGYAIAVDSSGSAYVAGGTASSSFPTTSNAFQSAYANIYGGSPPDAFVTKLTFETPTTAPERLTVTPNHHSFGRVPADATSKPVKITIANRDSTHQLPVLFSAVEMGSNYPIISNTCPVPPSQLEFKHSCIVTLACHPDYVGPAPAGVLRINDNSGGSPQQVTLSCTGKRPKTARPTATADSDLGEADHQSPFDRIPK